MSPSCESLLGYSQAEMEHINYNDLVHADNRNEAREAVRRLLEIARGGAKELPSCQQVQVLHAHKQLPPHALSPPSLTPFS